MADRRQPRPRIRSGHVCDDSCGLFYDPACPCWPGGDGALPWGPVTVSELMATLRSPHYGPQLRAALLGLLAEDIADAVAAALAAQAGRTS